MKKKTFNSILSVVLGMLIVVVLSVGTDYILESLGFFPSIADGLFDTELLVIAFLYRSIFTVIGGYLTASFAPNREMHHVRMLGVLGTMFGIAGVYFGWDLSQHWYPIALAVTAFPLVYLGGWLKTK